MTMRCRRIDGLALWVATTALLITGCAGPPEGSPSSGLDSLRSSSEPSPKANFARFMSSPVMREYYRLRKLKRLTEALAQLGIVIKTARRALGPRHPMITMFISWQANLLRKVKGPLAAAEAFAREAARWEKNLGGRLNPMVAGAHCRAGFTFEKAEAWSKAEGHLKQCVAIRLRLASGKPIPAAKRGRVEAVYTSGPRLAGLYTAVLRLAWVQGKLGHQQQAIAQLKRVLSLAQTAGAAAAARDRFLPRVLVALGVAYHELNNAAEAATSLAKALPGLRRHDGKTAEVTRRATDTLIKAYIKLGRSADAAQLRRELPAAMPR